MHRVIGLKVMQGFQDCSLCSNILLSIQGSVYVLDLKQGDYEVQVENLSIIPSFHMF
jgi:hypothetical protein